MKLKLIGSDDPRLRQKAAPASDFRSAAKLAADLLETMVSEGGVGLAAPQVGQAVRVFVSGVDGEHVTYINPEIIARSTKQIPWEEGCLSLPRLLGEVIRPKEVTVRYRDATGQSVERQADGLLARVIQHETDHLDGILFPDRMTDLSSLRKISEEEWQSRFEANQAQQPE